ncbi:hypothetical protein BHE74_00057613 [Ensete ventricosum]|nr:hypothetical protein BHE74_00057613 [Ensete ventricosum]
MLAPLSDSFPYISMSVSLKRLRHFIEHLVYIIVRDRKVAVEQPADASGSTARTSANKDKGMVELEEVPERDYTMQELCEVEDRAGADKYFASIMMRLKCTDSEDPLVPRWSTISGSSLIGQELVATTKRRAKELEGEVEKMQTKLESLRSQQRELEQEVGLLRSSLDGARNDRARLEGDVLSLTEATVFLETELKAEGQKAMAAYKASQGFESGLEKMGTVSYEFGYQVALKRLRGKHPDITIERDLFIECSKDANVKMDLDQPFGNGTPSEKQPTL